jgi:ATPase subunit of ABC transporter with duplicated ATPase domains
LPNTEKEKEMLKLSAVSKYFGSHRIFEDVNLALYPQERVALIGPRQSGKSTLLRILAGIEPCQRGHVAAPRWTWFGYLPQDVPRTNHTVAEMYQAARDSYFQMKGDSVPTGCPPCLGGLDSIHPPNGLLDCHGACGIGTRCRLMTLQFGIRHLPPSAKLSALESADRKRLWLAGLMLAPPDFLLLDEPTDNLDLQETVWFEQLLDGYPGTLVVASNDRALLDHVTDVVWEIDCDQHSVHRWKRDLHCPSHPAGTVPIITGTLVRPTVGLGSNRRQQELMYAS